MSSSRNPLPEINNRAKANARSGATGMKTKHRTGTTSVTDLNSDLNKLYWNLDKKATRTTIDRMNTPVRKSTVSLLRQGGGKGSIGRSQYGRMTRGDWRNPRFSPSSGQPYLRGGWYGDVLRKRGSDRPTMAHNGGRDGKRGIISKTRRSRTESGWYGVTGPVYANGDNTQGHGSVMGFNQAHILEFGGRHYNWGKKRKGTNLPARPFLGPAAKSTIPTQTRILKEAMTKWGKGVTIG